MRLRSSKVLLSFLFAFLLVTTVMGEDASVTEPPFPLTVKGSAQYAAGGTIIVGRMKAECTSANCTATFPVSGKVTIRFVLNQHSTFGQYIIDGKSCPGQSNNSCEVNVDKPMTVTFGVQPKRYNVTITFPPVGSITPVYFETPNGVHHSCINTGKPCTFSWEAGRPIIMTAESSAQYELEQWTGMCSGILCSTKLYQDTYLGMKLRKRKFTLSLSVVGAASGSVYSQPPAINCSKQGGQCSSKFTTGDIITLLLEPGGMNVEGLFGLQMCQDQKTPNRCTLSLGDNISMTVIFKFK